MTIQRVLCPTDFSSRSLEALRRAAAMARRHDAELHVLHVAHPTAAASAWASISASVPASASRSTSASTCASAPAFASQMTASSLAVPMLTASRLARRRRKPIARSEADTTIARALTDWVRRANLGDVATRIVTRVAARRGQVAAGVVAYAREAEADLIVMATSNRAGLSRLLQRSIAERVRRRAGVPVLTVRVDTLRPDPCARILCAVDLAHDTEAAIATMLALAERHEAEVRLLHVIDRPSAEEVLTVGYRSFSTFVERRQAEALAQLRARLPKEARPWRQGCARIVMGSPAESILDAAREWEADLIVLGPQRRGGLAAAIGGSTTEAVMRGASAAVLSAATPLVPDERRQIVLRWERVR